MIYWIYSVSVVLSLFISNFIYLDGSSFFWTTWLKVCQSLWCFGMQKIRVDTDIHNVSKYQEYLAPSLREHLSLPYKVHERLWKREWKDYNSWGWEECHELLSSGYDLAVTIINRHVLPKAQPEWLYCDDLESYLLE